MKRMTFKELRDRYLSNSDLLSICNKDTLVYENFVCLRNVPESYDDLYIYGIGMTYSEFPQLREGKQIAPCVEIMVSAKEVL